MAGNAGARFSTLGFLKLVKRSERNSILIEILGQRSDIPRPIFQQLIARASYEVRIKLERERPDLADEVQALVTDVTSQLHSVSDPRQTSIFVPKRHCSPSRSQLRHEVIFEFARPDKFLEVPYASNLKSEAWRSRYQGRTVFRRPCTALLAWSRRRFSAGAQPWPCLVQRALSASTVPRHELLAGRAKPGGYCAIGRFYYFRTRRRCTERLVGQARLHSSTGNRPIFARRRTPQRRPDQAFRQRIVSSRYPRRESRSGGTQRASGADRLRSIRSHSTFSTGR